MTFIKQHYQEVPILGICLGHQALGLFFGAKLVHAAEPKHGKFSEVNIEQDSIFHGLPQKIKVVRYHSLICRDLPNTLYVTATTSLPEIMAFRHKTLQIRGIQFHPEAALTEHGIDILRNWLQTIS